MTLSSQPPRYDSWRDMTLPIKQGATGWRAYAVQTFVKVEADGVWGPQTEQAVRKWQLDHRLASDGVVGPVTQQEMLELAGIRADRQVGFPEGVGYGFAVAEGANMLAATNWSQPGGVDCGPAQWRVLGPPRSTFPASGSLSTPGGR